MTRYDEALTFDANAAVLFEALKLPERCFYGEALIEDFLKSAYQDGYDEARSYWLAGVEVPEVPDEP